MKKYLVILLAVLLFFTSCTEIVYSHSSVMQDFGTKKSIVSRFGLPTEKREGEGIEEWLYDYGSVAVKSTYGNTRTNAGVTVAGNSAYGNSNTSANTVTRFSEYNRYIKFTLDQNGLVTNWKSQGVDLSVKKNNTGATVLFSIILIGATVGVASALSGVPGVVY